MLTMDCLTDLFARPSASPFGEKRSVVAAEAIVAQNVRTVHGSFGISAPPSRPHRGRPLARFLCAPLRANPSQDRRLKMRHQSHLANFSNRRPVWASLNSAKIFIAEDGRDDAVAHDKPPLGVTNLEWEKEHRKD
jgi:hypothetical protein